MLESNGSASNASSLPLTSMMSSQSPPPDTTTYSPDPMSSFEKDFEKAHPPIIFLYSIICVVGVVSNSCVVYIIASKRKMRNVTNYFIASLAISDILMSVFCVPFTFVANVLLDSWPFGETLCPIVTYLQTAVVFQNAYTLLAMSLERYIAIMHPFLQRLGKTRCLQIIVLCWVLAFLTPIPTAVTSKVVDFQDADNVTLQWCYEQWGSEDQRLTYTFTIMILQYFLPLFVLIFTYAQIVRVIWLKETPTPSELLSRDQARKSSEPAVVVPADPRKKIIKMMIMVVGIYAVCWFPLHATTIALDANPSLMSESFLRVAWVTAHWLAMSSCMYNPFIYWWMNAKIKEGYIHLFRQIKGLLCCQPYNHRLQGEMDFQSGGSRKIFSKFGNGSTSFFSRRISTTQVQDYSGVTYDGHQSETIPMTEQTKNGDVNGTKNGNGTHFGNREEA